MALSAKGDPLEAIDRLVPWESRAGLLQRTAAYRRGCQP